MLHLGSFSVSVTQNFVNCKKKRGNSRAFVVGGGAVELRLVSRPVE